MYEQKSSNTGYFKIFGIKVFEINKITTELYEREFVSDTDEQPLLGEYTTSVYKIFGISVMKFGADYDPNGKTETTDKPKLKISITAKKIIISLIAILLLLITFVGGIFTANSEWFNNLFYIKSIQMQNLEIKSLRPYNTALFKNAKTQTDMNIASGKRYEHYHKYFEKVVDRIRNYDYYDNNEKTAMLLYLDGYKERKAKAEKIMFPYKDKSAEDSGYGSMFGLSYPSAMLEFDRQELLTYRMILLHMYNIYPSVSEIDKMFEE